MTTDERQNILAECFQEAAKLLIDTERFPEYGDFLNEIANKPDDKKCWASNAITAFDNDKKIKPDKVLDAMKYPDTVSGHILTVGRSRGDKAAAKFMLAAMREALPRKDDRSYVDQSMYGLDTRLLNFLI